LRSIRAYPIVLLGLSMLPVLAVLAYATWRDTDTRIANASAGLRAAAERTAASVDADVRGAVLFLQALVYVPMVAQAEAWSCERLIPLVVPHRRYSAMLVAKPDGTPACATIALPAGVNYANRDYFRQALGANAPVRGVPVISRARGTAILPVAFAARDGSGRVSAVLVVTLDPANYPRGSLCPLRMAKAAWAGSILPAR